MCEEYCGPKLGEWVDELRSEYNRNNGINSTSSSIYRVSHEKWQKPTFTCIILENVNSRMILLKPGLRLNAANFSKMTSKSPGYCHFSWETLYVVHQIKNCTFLFTIFTLFPFFFIAAHFYAWFTPIGDIH